MFPCQDRCTLPSQRQCLIGLAHFKPLSHPNRRPLTMVSGRFSRPGLSINCLASTMPSPMTIACDLPRSVGPSPIIAPASPNPTQVTSMLFALTVYLDSGLSPQFITTTWRAPPGCKYMSAKSSDALRPRTPPRRSQLVNVMCRVYEPPSARPRKNPWFRVGFIMSLGKSNCVRPSHTQLPAVYQ